MIIKILPVSLLLGGLLLCAAGAAAQQPRAPLPATVPAYEPPPGKPYFTEPAEAGAAAVTEGLVVDDSGRPVHGVTCWIRGSQLAVFTGPDGRYRLPVPPRYLSHRGLVRVTMSGIGFVGQALKLDARQAEQPVVRLLTDKQPWH